MKPGTPESGGELRRQLGLGSATAAVAAEAVAVGVFLTPADMAKTLGSPLWLLLVWMAIAVMTLCGAFNYGELTGRYPRAGGSYAFLRETFGRPVAFLYGWMCLLVLDPGLTAALATGTANYAAFLFHWNPQQIKLGAMALIASLCVLNALSVRLSAGVLRWVTWLKLATLALLVVWAFGFGRGSWANFVPFVAQRVGSLPLGPALASAMVAAFFSFGGWWDVTKIAGEVRDPERTLPRAMVLGVGVVTAVYVLVSAAFWYLIPLEKVTTNEAFVAQAGEVLFGAAGGRVLAAIVVVCVASGVAAFMMAAPRVYYAMAKDGLFLAQVGKLDARLGTPVNAIAIQGMVACALVWMGSFQQILAYFIFPAVAFLGLTVAGVFVVRARKEAAPAGTILAAGYPWTTLMFLVMVAGMLVLLLAHSPREPLLGTAVVLAGVPVYWLFLRGRGEEEGSKMRDEVSLG
jgi:APA family basic amino acid/polyamine antiporter